MAQVSSWKRRLKDAASHERIGTTRFEKASAFGILETGDVRAIPFTTLVADETPCWLRPMLKTGDIFMRFWA